MIHKKAIDKEVSQLELNWVIVDDGSIHPTENSELEKLRTHNINYLNYKENKGKGYAIKQGVKHTESEYYLFTDIDFPYTTDSFIKILNSLLSGYYLSIGQRETSYYESLPKRRKFISKFLQFFIRFIFRIPTADTQCGLKGFSKDVKELVLSAQTNRFLFDLELIKDVYARYPKKIDLVTVTLRDDVVFSDMSLQILLKEAGNFLAILFKSNKQNG